MDDAGRLHLRIAYRGGRWRCAEVILDRSLGYGMYTFTITSPVGDLDPNVVLGMFTWDDDPACNHREMDVEFARWGDAMGTTNAQYTVQPSDRSGNVKRFVQPTVRPSVHSFKWSSISITFASRRDSQTIASWVHSGADVPAPGRERARINLWLHGGSPPTNGADVEVVLSRFRFTPLVSG